MVIEWHGIKWMATDYKSKWKFVDELGHTDTI